MAKEKFKLTSAIYQAMERSLSHSEHQLVPVGLVGVVGFPLFYYVWTYVFPQNYENLELRLLGAFFTAGLMLHSFWPKRWLKYLPVWWYITILYCLPFFFFFIMLKNNAAVVPSMAMLIAIFLMILLVDWISLLVMLTSGMLFGALAYYLSTPQPIIPEMLWTYFGVFAFAIVAGAVFNYKTALLHQHRLEGMASVTGNIAHELRTPLLGIKGGIEGLRHYLPILFSAYKLAKENSLKVQTIRRVHLQNLLPALDRMEGETRFANTIIDMLLMNVGKKTNIGQENFHISSIKSTVDEALKRYPFDSAEEAEKIHWDNKRDFNYYGSKILMIHVLFNLIKNALHFIVKAEKGEIFIWLSQGEKYNHLHFKDTGLGIKSRVLPHIFDRFYTTTLTGTGIGLSYCKVVMESFNGDIKCYSEEDHYTEFTLSFPAELPDEPIG
ncbi:MAG: HAMP domain-containing sensor histidine kinase [Pseudomonadota bacterium]